jgi:hypothetical protein
MFTSKMLGGFATFLITQQVRSFVHEAEEE